MGYSRWQLVDLQVHTPADRNHKFGDVGGPEPNPEFARRLVEAHAEAGVTAIAVTDHNRLDWYPVLAEAGASIGVTVFPGFEFNVNKCHLLAVWDACDAGHRLGVQFLSTLFGPGMRPLASNREPLPVSSGSPLDLALRAIDHKALVFAPHATARDNGLFGRNVCNISDQVAQSGAVIGFDVAGHTGADVLRNPRSQFANQSPTWFISGDLRSFEDVGKRAVYLKVDSSPTLESLRQAFLMPDRRIRFQEQHRQTYSSVPGIMFMENPEPTWPTIERISIQGGFHDGLEVELGPGLNAIIGGKGTGKSTLVEIIRHVTHAPTSTQPESERNRRANFPANAEARLGVLTDDGERYDLVRAGDAQSTRLLRESQDVGIASHRRFSVRVFGQRELSGLPDQPDALRDFLAEHSGSELNDAREEERRLLAEAGELGAEIAHIELALGETAESEERLADLLDQLQRAADGGAFEVVRESQDLTAADQQCSAIQKWPQTLRKEVERLQTAAAQTPDLTPHESVPAEISGTLARASNEIRATTHRLTSLIEDLTNEITPLLNRQAERSANLRHDISIRLAEAGLLDPDDLARKQKDAAELENRVRGVPALKERLSRLAGQRHDLLEQLRYTRRQISRELESAASRLTERAGDHVRVWIDPLGDHGPLQRLLGQFLSGQSVRAEQISRLAAVGPAALAEAIANGSRSVAALGVSDSTATKVAKLSPDEIRALEEAYSPDVVKVDVDLGTPDAVRWVPLHQVSPGQRSTAMLALALATGNEPLLIDQPEDDLDNRYIYEKVVTLLANVSDRRQVIVATHNANIPVLGDAELVLALTANAESSEVLACGGLDEPDVAQQAREILEGGDDAFRARARRYQHGV